MTRMARIAVAGAAAAGIALGAAVPASASADRAQAAVPVTVWASDVRLHVGPHVGDPSPTTTGPGQLVAVCQTPGDVVTYAGYSSGWWSLVELPGGSDDLFISNVFLKGGEKIAGVPDC